MWASRRPAVGASDWLDDFVDRDITRLIVNLNSTDAASVAIRKLCVNEDDATVRPIIANCATRNRRALAGWSYLGEHLAHGRIVRDKAKLEWKSFGCPVLRICK